MTISLSGFPLPREEVDVFPGRGSLHRNDLSRKRSTITSRVPVRSTLTGSEVLTVDRRDVLRDPKLRNNYRHPAFAVKWGPADSKPKRRDTA
jgi:hypothetical protein